VASAANGVIGCDNRLPWHLPQDLKYFKSVTFGKPVVMGRKTWDSIGRPLPGRTNIVVTRQADWPAPDGVLVAHDLPEALGLAGEVLAASVTATGETDPGKGLQEREVMVMGGAEIYRQALPMASRVYLTRVELEPKGDAWFPALAEDEWRQVSAVEGDRAAPVVHRFLVFERF
jgi:dihydrofolate reductase